MKYSLLCSPIDNTISLWELNIKRKPLNSNFLDENEPFEINPSIFLSINNWRIEATLSISVAFRLSIFSEKQLRWDSLLILVREFWGVDAAWVLHSDKKWYKQWAIIRSSFYHNYFTPIRARSWKRYLP